MASRRGEVDVGVAAQGSAEAGDPRMGGTPSERMAAVDVLTRHVWALSGREFPTYTRATMPFRLTTLAAQDEQDAA